MLALTWKILIGWSQMGGGVRMYKFNLSRRAYYDDMVHEERLYFMQRWRERLPLRSGDILLSFPGAFQTHQVQGAVHVRRSSFCFIRRRQGCRQRALPAVSVKPESSWTGFTLGGQEAREGWVSTVEEEMHTSSSSETVAWWLATGLPEWEESQPAAPKRITFPHNLLPDAI